MTSDRGAWDRNSPRLSPTAIVKLACESLAKKTSLACAPEQMSVPRLTLQIKRLDGSCGPNKLAFTAVPYLREYTTNVHNGLVGDVDFTSLNVCYRVLQAIS